MLSIGSSWVLYIMMPAMSCQWRPVIGLQVYRETVILLGPLSALYDSLK